MSQNKELEGQNSWTLIHVMPVCRQLLLRNDPGRESSLHMPPSHSRRREGGNVRGTLSLVRPSLTDSVCGRRRRVEVVNAVDDRRRRAEGEGTIVGPLGVKRGREGGTYLYLLPRLSPPQHPSSKRFGGISPRAGTHHSSGEIMSNH